MSQPDIRYLSLGWGIQSWTLAAMAALGEIPPLNLAIHADTTHEMAGTYAHAAKWQPWLEAHGVPVVTVKPADPGVFGHSAGGKPALQIPAFGGYGQVNRQCTGHWKIEPIRRELRRRLGKGRPRAGAVEAVLGISLDEWHRMKSSNVAYIVNTYPLVDMRLSRAGCVDWLNRHGLEIPPKSACSFCPYHGKAGWKALKAAGGPDWERAVAVDEAIRKTTPKFDMFLHSSKLPLAEAVRIPEDFGAKQPDMFDENRPCDGGTCFV